MSRLPNPLLSGVDAAQWYGARFGTGSPSFPLVGLSSTMARNSGFPASRHVLGRAARAQADWSARAARYRLVPPLAATSR